MDGHAASWGLAPARPAPPPSLPECFPHGGSQDGGPAERGEIRSCCHYGGCPARLRSLASLLGALGTIAVPCPFCRAGAEAVLGGGLPESGWRPGGAPLPEPRQAAPCTPPGGRKGGASRLSGPNHGQRQEGPTVSSAGCARPRDHPGSNLRPGGPGTAHSDAAVDHAEPQDPSHAHTPPRADGAGGGALIGPETERRRGCLARSRDLQPRGAASRGWGGA